MTAHELRERAFAIVNETERRIAPHLNVYVKEEFYPDDPDDTQSLVSRIIALALEYHADAGIATEPEPPAGIPACRECGKVAPGSILGTCFACQLRAATDADIAREWVDPDGPVEGAKG